MSYEYRNKRIIENFARRYTTSVSDEVDILFELDHVYTQATKADEYEAKAKTFDAILKANDEAFAIEHMAREVSNIIEKYESGEYDA